MVREVVIIGSGPAGYTAAVYTSRAQLDPLVFAGSLSGGQLMLTTDVECCLPPFTLVRRVDGPVAAITWAAQLNALAVGCHDGVVVC